MERTNEDYLANGVINAVCCYKKAVQFSASFVVIVRQLLMKYVGCSVDIETRPYSVKASAAESHVELFLVTRVS